MGKAPERSDVAIEVQVQGLYRKLYVHMHTPTPRPHTISQHDI